jgi:hypothetical protein
MPRRDGAVARGPLALALGLERHARRIRLPGSLVPPSGLRAMNAAVHGYGGGGTSVLIGR